MSMFATEAAAADKFVNHPDDPAGPASLPVDAIEPAASQPRRGISDESISELAESIADHGVLQPILVEPAASRERGAGIADHGAPNGGSSPASAVGAPRSRPASKLCPRLC